MRIYKFLESDYYYLVLWVHSYTVFVLRVTGVTDILQYPLGHATTCTHTCTFLIYTHTLIFTPSILPANPHYPSVLTESFSSPGHRKGSPAASQTLTCPKTPLPSPPPHSFSLHSLSLSLPVLLPSLCHFAALSVIQINFELVFCVFLCKVAVSFNLVTRAAMRSEKKTLHNPLES